MVHRHAEAHRVDLVVYPGFKALEAVGPMSVFDYANGHLRQNARPDGYEVRVAASQAGCLRSDDADGHAYPCRSGAGWHGLHRGVGGLAQYRAGEGSITRHGVLDLPYRALGGAPDRAVLRQFFLAAAGLLDGRRAATHWSVAGLRCQRYPAIDVDPDAIYVRGGHLWTSAGVTAGIDLAQAVARDLAMYFKRPVGQSQFRVQLASQRTGHRDIPAVQNWLLEHLEEPISLTALAGRAATSEHHFRRVFVQEIGQNPSAFVESARLKGV